MADRTETTAHRARVFTGAATAIVTPFAADGTIDYPSLGRMIARQIDGAIDALVVCGTTGEAASLTGDEYRAILRYTVDAVQGRVPVIAGCGSNDTATAIELAKCACTLGADALLVITPYYNKATPMGLIRHFTAIADASDKPILLYNVPSRTGVDIPLSVYPVLAAHPRIVGVKEASGDLAKAAHIVATCGPDFALYSGSDDSILPNLSIGADGVISVVSNLLPRETHLLCERYFQGDTVGAWEIQRALLPLIDALLAEVNPIPVKTACGMLGLCQPTLRLPLCEMETPHRAALEKALVDWRLYRR